MYCTKDILPLTLKNLGFKNNLVSQTIIFKWEDIVGNDIATHCCPHRVKNGVLFLSVDNPVWGHHLSIMKLQLISKINHYLSEQLIKDIKVFAGDLSHRPNLLEDEPTEQFAPLLAKLQLTTVQCMKVSETVKTVNDSALKYRFRRLLIKDQKFKLLKQQSGWQPCLNCSVLCAPPAKYCTACSLHRTQQQQQQLRMLLFETPWLRYKDVFEFKQCTKAEYIRAKQELIQSLMLNTHHEQPDPIKLASLVMLLFKIEPNQINDFYLEKTLRFVRRSQYVFTYRR